MSKYNVLIVDDEVEGDLFKVTVEFHRSAQY